MAERGGHHRPEVLSEALQSMTLPAYRSVSVISMLPFLQRVSWMIATGFLPVLFSAAHRVLLTHSRCFQILGAEEMAQSVMRSAGELSLIFKSKAECPALTG